MMAAQSPTSRAILELHQAALNLGLAAETLVGLANGAQPGKTCACGDGHSCAYHAGLINDLDHLRRRTANVLQSLEEDLKNPNREH